MPLLLPDPALSKSIAGSCFRANSASCCSPLARQHRLRRWLPAVAARRAKRPCLYAAAAAAAAVAAAVVVIAGAGVIVSVVAAAAAAAAGARTYGNAAVAFVRLEVWQQQL